VVTYISPGYTNKALWALDLDIMCGDYRRAIAANSEAILADERFVAREGPFNFYSLYRTHNYHFRIYAAMFSGQSRIALESVAQIEKSFPEELLRVESPPMADWLEGILSMRVHVFIRFGLWNDLLNLKLPKNQQLYCVTTAMIHYGQGVAFAATGKIAEAIEERELFRDAVSRVPSSRTIFANKCIDVLAVAGAMLDGELAYRQGNFDLAFEELRRSISLMTRCRMMSHGAGCNQLAMLTVLCYWSKGMLKKRPQCTAPILVWITRFHGLCNTRIMCGLCTDIMSV
jgi:hypothetical protein